MIQLFKPKVHPEAFDNVKRVLESGWLGLGPEVEKFEKELAKYIGADYVWALSSGTAALRLAVWAAKFEPGSFVITTPNTFVSTNHVLLQAGLKPIFTDINPNTGSMDYNSLYRCLKWNFPVDRKPVAVMVVHLTGMPADMDEIHAIASDNDLIIIEDCSHAFGATYKQRKIGANIPYGCSSLHAVKPFMIGEGGMFTTNDSDIADMVRKGRWLGIDKSTYDRSRGNNYDWEYNVPLLGYKAHMCDIMAAIGRGQLIHLEEDAKRRQEIVNRYRKNLEGIVQLMDNPDDRTSANYLIVVRFTDWNERDRIMTAFRKNDIQYGHHYAPHYNYPMYRHCLIEAKKGTELYYSTAISLPLHLYLTDDEVDFICKIIKEEIK